MKTITKRIREDIYTSLVSNNQVENGYINFNDLSEDINANLLVLMFDYYNLLYVRQKIGDINRYDIYFLKFLESCSFEDLFSIFKSNKYYISKALASNYIFNTSTLLEQQNLMYELHFCSDKNILTNNLLYMTDILNYMPSSNINNMVECCREYIIQNFPNFDGRIDAILFNLEALRNLDYDKYKDVILEILHDFYKLDKYRLSQEKHLEIKNRLYHLLIKYASNDKIVSISTKNKKMMYDIVDLYLSNKVFIPNYKYSEIINESEKNMSQKLIKKFNSNKKET